MLLCNHIKIVKIAKLTLRPCWYQRYILKAMKFHVCASNAIKKKKKRKEHHLHAISIWCPKLETFVYFHWLSWLNIILEILGSTNELFYGKIYNVGFSDAISWLDSVYSHFTGDSQIVLFQCLRNYLPFLKHIALYWSTVY